MIISSLILATTLICDSRQFETGPVFLSNNNTSVANTQQESGQSGGYEDTIDSFIEITEAYEEKTAAGGIVIEYIIIEAAEEYSGVKLTKSAGRVQGPSGEETWYNLPMGRCIDIMRDLGYTVEEYPYWVREDGCKMLGDYIMVGANTYSMPKGTIVDTTLGKGIVADHCVAAESKQLLDIAVTW